MLPGGVVKGGGVLAQGVSNPGVCVLSWGMSGRGGDWWIPPLPGTATCTRCTHPTGMHSSDISFNFENMLQLWEKPKLWISILN